MYFYCAFEKHLSLVGLRKEDLNGLVGSLEQFQVLGGSELEPLPRLNITDFEILDE